MTHDPEPIAPHAVEAAGETTDPAAPLPLPWLVASTLLIVLGAVVIASLLAVLVVLGLYARVGIDGLREVYQDLRFDLAFKTEVGAVVVATFYASIAAATIGVSWWRSDGRWRRPIAWYTPSGSLWTILAIFAATLVYAGLATSFLTLSQQKPVIHVDGPTNFVLLGTFAGNLVIMAPLAEELFFRGWLFTNLRARFTFWPTLLTTALLFAAIHLDLHRPRVLLVLPLAFAAGFVRELTGSVKPAIALHVAYNLVIVTVKLWET